MLRQAAIVLLLCTIAAEANRCKYRESRRPQALEIRRPRLCRGAGSFIGEDYWTSIGYDGQIREGRSRADFLTFDQTTTGYIAYWITRTKYGNTHYEAFGHAFVRPDGRTCAWFVGLNRELIEVCGGFRILSRNRYNPQEALPFEWVQVNDYITPKNTLGFHEHRIAKFQGDNEAFYGDARLQDRNFQGVSPSTESFTEVTSPAEFERRVWLLRRKADSPAPEPSNIRTGGGDLLDSRYPDPRVPDSRRYDPRTQGYRQEADPRYKDFEHVRGDPRLDNPSFVDWLMRYDKAFANVTPDVWRYLRGEQQPYAVGSGAMPHGAAPQQRQEGPGNDGWQVVGERPQEPERQGEPLGDTGSQGLVPFSGPQPGFDGETGTGLGQRAQPQRPGADYGRTDAYGRPIGPSGDVRPGVMRPSVGHGAQPGDEKPGAVDSQGRPIGQGVQPGGVDAYGRPIGQGAHPSGGSGAGIGQGVQPGQGSVDAQGRPIGQGVGVSDDQGRSVGEGVHPSGVDAEGRPVGQGFRPEGGQERDEQGRPIGGGARPSSGIGEWRPVGQGVQPGQVDEYGRPIGQGAHPLGSDAEGRSVGQGVQPGQGQVDAYGRPIGQGAQPGQVDAQGRGQPGQGQVDAYGRPISQGSQIDEQGRPIGQGAHPSGGDAEGRPVGQGAQPSSGNGSVDQYGRPIGGQSGQWRGTVDGRPVPGRSESVSYDSYGRPIDAQGRPLADSQRTDAYGRPIDAYGRPIGTGAYPSQKQEMADGRPVDPSGAQTGYPGVGRGAQPQSGTQNYAKIRPPTIIRDEYGTIYKQTVINGHTYFYADPHVQGKQQVQIADTPSDARLDNEQWLRQQEHMRRMEEERRQQEQRVRDQWAREPQRLLQGRPCGKKEGQQEGGQQPEQPRREEPRAPETPKQLEQPKTPEEPKKEPEPEVPKTEESSGNGEKPMEPEEKQDTVEASGSEDKMTEETGGMEHEAEEPVPFEKEEPETNEQPEQLPPPKQTAEEVEEDEDDQDA